VPAVQGDSALAKPNAHALAQPQRNGARTRFLRAVAGVGGEDRPLLDDALRLGGVIGARGGHPSVPLVRQSGGGAKASQTEQTE
jgi:hypothetical protein